MAEDPKEILEMSDYDLQRWTLSGEAGSYVHQIGQTALNMRCALRMADVTREMASANRDLVNSTVSLVHATRKLVTATWALVLITLLTQIAMIVLLALKK